MPRRACRGIMLSVVGCECGEESSQPSNERMSVVLDPSLWVEVGVIRKQQGACLFADDMLQHHLADRVTCLLHRMEQRAGWTEMGRRRWAILKAGTAVGGLTSASWTAEYEGRASM